MFLWLEASYIEKILTKNTMDLFFFNLAGVLHINIDMGKTLQQIWEW